MISALVMSVSFVLSAKFSKRILNAKVKTYKLAKAAKEKARRKKTKKIKKKRKSKPRFDDDFSYLIK